MKKRVLCGLVTAMFVISLTACGGGESTGTDSEVITGEAGSTYTGTVSAISADSITATTEEYGDVTIALSDSTAFNFGKGGGQPGGMGDAPGEAPAGVTGEAPAGVTGEAPEGIPGDAPEGVRGDGRGPITITYENVMVGDAVTVVVGEDGTAETVTLISGFQDHLEGSPSDVEDEAATAEDTTETEGSDAGSTSTGTN